MTFNRKSRLTTGLLALFILGACSPKEPAQPERTSSRIEQLKMQSRMKALAAEVVKLRESQKEVEQLKASIAAMDSQVVLYKQQLEAREAEPEPEVKIVAPPKDPDVINLKGNIYVLNREIDSLKQGMKSLIKMNDSLEVQIEQLAVQTNTVPEKVAPEEAMPIEESPYAVVESQPIPESEPVLEEEPPMAALPAAQGYSLKSDYRMAYNDALNLYFNKEYLDAIQDFRILIQREPYGAYADNAQYWIGECYYSLEDYESAITEFNKVFTFAENNKSDHALFKIAISYQKLGRYMKARETMEQVTRDYPGSELISQARDFLEANR